MRKRPRDDETTDVVEPAARKIGKKSIAEMGDVLGLFQGDARRTGDTTPRVRMTQEEQKAFDTQRAASNADEFARILAETNRMTAIHKGEMRDDLRNRNAVIRDAVEDDAHQLAFSMGRLAVDPPPDRIPVMFVPLEINRPRYRNGWRE